MLNKTFRLFISSTFSDFILERNILNDKVFPVVDDYCQQRGYNFQLIDLRWGVTNESALNQNTLAICIDEVKRCKTLSPKPNFLLMAGERYGWVPLPTNIQIQDFNEILSVASIEEKSLLSEWYILDENKINGEYYLKNRRGEYVDDSIWFETEKRLYNALYECIVNKLMCDDKKIYELTSSATEKEIIEGLLECDGICDNTIALFRNNFPEKDENLERITDLRKKIIKRMSGDGLDLNILELDWGQDYENIFEKKIISLIINNIDNEIQRLRAEEQNINYKDDLKVYFENNNIIFDREEINILYDYVNGDRKTPFYLYGDSGSGKTTLLSQFALNCDDTIFYSFYGINENSYTLLSSLQKIVNDIKYYFQIQKNLYMDEFNISEIFFQALNAIPKDEKVIIILDAFEMFHDISDLKEKVIPTLLPDNVKIIISSASIEVINKIADTDSQIFKLDWLDACKSKHCFDMFLKQNNRCVSSKGQRKIVTDILKNGATPLQLKMLSQECLTWHSLDVIESFPTSVEELALRHLINMFTKFGHNKELVLYALALICAAPYGITEDELQILLLRFETVRDYFVSEDRYAYNMEKLPFAVWSRLFYDLKGCLSLTKVKGLIMVKFTHQVFYKVFFENFKTYLDDATSVMITYYENESNYVKNSKMPNIKKALGYAELLKKSGNTQKLCQILTDFTYVDSAIKVGNLNEVLLNLQFVIKNFPNNTNLDLLKVIYICIQQNKTMLSCYYGEFFNCIKNYIPSLEANTFFSVDTTVVSDSIYFPYSYFSEISWSKKGDKYAVISNSYIYICSMESNAEICRIYLEPSADDLVIAKKVLWLNEYAIGVLTNESCVNVYDFSDNIPNLVCSHNCKDEILYFGISIKNKILFLQSGKYLYAVVFNTNKTIFSIELNNFAAFSSCVFEIDEERNYLYIKNRKYILIYHILDGHLLEKKRLKSSSFFDKFNKPDIHRVNDYKFLLYDKDSKTQFMIFDVLSREETYIHPPGFDKLKDLVIGIRYILFVYSDFLIITDLTGKHLMRWIRVSGVNSVAWKKIDECLSVLTNNGLKIYSIEDFNLFSEDSYCMPSKKNLFSSLFMHRNFSHDLSTLLELGGLRSHLNNAFDYQYIFNIRNLSKKISDLNTSASIVVFANDGKVAVVFEDKDSILIYDKNKQPILLIDKLRFAIANDLLKLCFSPNSKYLLILRNDSVQIIEISSGKKLVDFDVIWRPVLNARFSDDSETLIMLLCNGIEYRCKISAQEKCSFEQIPEKLVSDFHLDDYFGPYNYFQADDSSFVTIPYLDFNSFDYNSNVKNWFNETRVYYGDNYWLYYNNGNFYLNGDLNKSFSHEFFDFHKSHQLQKLQDANAIKYYLMEKNDLFSKIYQYDNYLVLVSRMLNSIIVFDITSMLVIAAYRVEGRIIGFSENREVNAIELVIDCEPYYKTVYLNFND